MKPKIYGKPTSTTRHLVNEVSRYQSFLVGLTSDTCESANRVNERISYQSRARAPPYQYLRLLFAEIQRDQPLRLAFGLSRW